MTVKEAIINRKSIRSYLPDPVDKELLLEVIEAGRLAPSAMNAQKWHFVLVTDPAVQKKMAEASDCQQAMEQAPSSIAVCATDNRKMLCGADTAQVDCSIAMSFMILRAEELGLGTCWLGHFYEDMVKDILSLPESYRVIAVTPIGIPAETPAARPRHNIENVLTII